jgi:hypothetical protein
MGELDENVWAVISKRGVEVTGLSYEAAVHLRQTLESANVYGLCIVTNHAAECELENRKKMPDSRC